MFSTEAREISLEGRGTLKWSHLLRSTVGRTVGYFNVPWDPLLKLGGFPRDNAVGAGSARHRGGCDGPNRLITSSPFSVEAHMYSFILITSS